MMKINTYVDIWKIMVSTAFVVVRFATKYYPTQCAACWKT